MRITVPKFTAHLRAEQQTALDNAKMHRMNIDRFHAPTDEVAKWCRQETYWMNAAASIGTWMEDINAGRALVPQG